MNPIVGGLFGLEDPLGRGEPPPWVGREQHVLLTANARGSIRWLVEHLAVRTVWVPAYLCHTMIDWIVDRDKRTLFYPVDNRLRAVRGQWLNDILPGDLVLIVAWFGRRVEMGLGTELKNRGAIVLEDASQAWFTSGLGEESDWLVYSPRKFVGVVDGGVLISLRGESLVDFHLPEPPSFWWSKLFAACLGRRIFDEVGDTEGSRQWFEWMREADKNAPLETNSISEFSKRRMEQGLPARDYSRRRESNHEILEHGLGEFSLFGKLDLGEVPLGFVSLFPSREVRDAVRHHLIVNKIYPMIHWPISGVVPDGFSESHYLNSRILTLVCDQRYGEMEMKHTIALVRDITDAA